ncbi:MAG: hypothetical protein WD824_13015 [Cyclobacteriaceae bacterium]
MTLRFRRLKNTTPIAMAIFVKAILILIAYLLPVNLLDRLGSGATDYSLMDSAPEIWLSLLAFVFGTLIIVISIASEKAPKLIDLFVAEYWSQLFIWLIALSGMENIYLHFVHSGHAMFSSNLVFLNNYIFLPCLVIVAIPYIFYILKFTKSSNVIKKIYDENLRAVRAIKGATSEISINRNHYHLFETINQLHDLLQHIEFKEPKADIIHRFGKSLRFYLGQKKRFPADHFKLTDSAKNDISFRTLGEKYGQIEAEKTLYEQKVLRVLGTSYLLLIKESHYDLASLCGHELYASGKTAIELNDQQAVDTVLIHFNTILRFGISHGLKTREIRNVYNTIYHYSQLVNAFIEKREEERVVQCCRYFAFYANVVGKLSVSEQLFVFLIETFAIELKKILMSLHINNFSREQQIIVLRMFNELNGDKKIRSYDYQWIHNSGLRLIQIALCLFYMSRQEYKLMELTVASILKDLRGLNKNQTTQILKQDCERIKEEREDFWEETDQGSRNIYYSQHKVELNAFHAYVSEKVEEIYAKVDDEFTSIKKP